MDVIQQLDENLINQIAAGEVIERPSSVIKELVENALDAQADDITISLDAGGLSLIRIQDNGKGIAHEQLKIAVQRHTTSKLSTTQDLFNIKTLGFRGEALASIASVSKLLLSSNHAGSGYLYNVLDDVVSPTSCPPGTIIEVRDLFYNTPARKKYMKQETTEYRRCLEVIQAYALAYPSIGFKVQHNSIETLNVAPSTLHNRIASLLGADIAKDMIPIENNAPDNAYALEGYISKPNNIRKDKRGHYFFVNKRLIQSPTLSAALTRGYEGTIHHGTYPIGVLFLRIHPRLIDVNCHPQKAQIRFEDEQSVFRLVFHATKQTLQATNLLRTADAQTLQPQQSLNSVPVQSVIREPTQHYNVEPSTQGTLSEVQTHTIESDKFDTFRVLGLSNKKFIVAEKKGSLILVDFHAAHERINYELLKDEYQDKGIAHQQLMQSVTLPCSPVQVAALQEFSDALHKLVLQLNHLAQIV